MAALEKQRRVRVIVVNCLADWAFRYRNLSAVSASGIGHCCCRFARVVVFKKNFNYKRRREEETLKWEFFPEEGGVGREGNRR